jgi:L-alanine-DL-glutamate epimerase-like enolase superfamily enzyme
LGTAVSLHASNASLAAVPNVTLLETPWANHDGKTDVCWPYLEIEDGYALPLEGPGLGIEADEASVDEELAATKRFVPSLLGPRERGQLNALDGSVRDF